LPAEVFAEARMKLAEQVSEAMSTSAQRYFQLERVEAAGAVHDLERALADVRELEKRRADLWQQAAHDLRGNLGVVSNVAQGSPFRDLPADRRDEFVALLSNNVTALRHLLDDVTALARLQAGQEERRVAPFDAADLLRRLCDDVRPLADAKKLSLAIDGPATLQVEGDAVKVRRIAQNLLLNALKYTRSGRVVLSWGEAAPGDARRWRHECRGQRPGLPRRAGRADRQLAQPVGRERAARRSARQPGRGFRATTIRARSISRRAKGSAWRSSSACATCSTPSSSSRPWPSTARRSASSCRALLTTRPRLSGRRAPRAFVAALYDRLPSCAVRTCAARAVETRHFRREVRMDHRSARDRRGAQTPGAIPATARRPRPRVGAARPDRTAGCGCTRSSGAVPDRLDRERLAARLARRAGSPRSAAGS
jgi:hypothetical protein